MKILTLNTHSLMEENYEEKLKQFAEMIKKELSSRESATWKGEMKHDF